MNIIVFLYMLSFHILIIKMTLLDLFLGKLHFELTQYSVFLLKP